MGIYVFHRKLLFEQLRRDAADPNSAHDFGKDLIPYIVANGKAVAHRFTRSCVRSQGEEESYWRDVGTVDAYWEANIDLTDVVPALDLYDQDWPIWTNVELTAPAKFVHDLEGRRGMAISSMVAGDCIVSGSAIRRSLLFTGVRVNSFSAVEEAVVLPRARIARNVRLKKVVVDRGVHIPEGLVVGEDPELDAKRFRRTDSGVCLITQADARPARHDQGPRRRRRGLSAGQDRRPRRCRRRPAGGAEAAWRRDAGAWCPAIRRSWRR